MVYLSTCLCHRWFIHQCLVVFCILLFCLSAKSLQSCPTLCDLIDARPPGSPVPGILQPRTLEWVAISFSNAWKWKVKVKSFSRIRLLATPWTAAYQAPLFIGFSRQEYWSGVPDLYLCIKCYILLNEKRLLKIMCMKSNVYCMTLLFFTDFYMHRKKWYIYSKVLSYLSCCAFHFLFSVNSTYRSASHRITSRHDNGIESLPYGIHQ